MMKKIMMKKNKDEEKKDWKKKQANGEGRHLNNWIISFVKRASWECSFSPFLNSWIMHDDQLGYGQWNFLLKSSLPFSRVYIHDFVCWTENRPRTPRHKRHPRGTMSIRTYCFDVLFNHSDSFWVFGSLQMGNPPIEANQNVGISRHSRGSRKRALPLPSTRRYTSIDLHTMRKQSYTLTLDIHNVLYMQHSFGMKD